MPNFKAFVRSGHWPTLLAALSHFDFIFAVWVLNGAMAEMSPVIPTMLDTLDGFNRARRRWVRVRPRRRRQPLVWRSSPDMHRFGAVRPVGCLDFGHDIALHLEAHGAK